MFTQKELNVLNQARRILASKIKDTDPLTNPELTKDYCQFNLADCEHEVFAALFLDGRHRVIEYVELFRGTVDGASVYPREVIKEALARNAVAVIFAHNHPSGNPAPSRADQAITTQLAEGLRYIDVRVLDHIVVGVEGAYSFAEHGLL